MKICLISGALPDVSCGVGDYVDALACAFADHDHEVVVITTSSPDLRQPSRYRVVEIDTGWSFKGVGRVAAAARLENPDVLHLQYPGMGYGRGFGATFAPWAIRLRGRRPLLVTTLHEFHAFRLQHRWRLALAVAACDLVMAPDPVVLASVRRHLRWRRGLRTEMIPVGANIRPSGSCEPGRARSQSEELIVGYWGLQRPDKGVDVLLEAFLRVLRVRPARLILAGDPGPDKAYVEWVKRRAEELGLAGWIQWTGKLPAERLSSVLQGFDVCALPFRDGLSQNRGTYAGSVIHGLYTVTTSNDKSGYEKDANTSFVPPGDVDRLAAAILNSSGHYRRPNPPALNDAWDEIACRHLAAYREVMGAPRDD